MVATLRLTAAAALLVSTAQSLWVNTTEHPNGYWNYTTVRGFFLQDDPATNATTFDYTAYNFGLINRTYPSDSSSYGGSRLTQWQRFIRYVNSLNKAAPDRTFYKLIWFGRHAEGYHNAAESYYGTPAWNCYWSELDGNGTVSWSDARLTPAGIASAQLAHDYWQSRHRTQKLPYPESYYTSPLTRCLQTADLTFSGLRTSPKHPFVPTVKELLREGISIHTCDRRGTRSSIERAFPRYAVEPTLPEQDYLWAGIAGEPSGSQDVRSKLLLDDIFAHDAHTYLSVTSHSGEIASLLRVLGHQAFSLSTGAIIPVLVRAAMVDPAAAPTATWTTWTTQATCLAPPVTSVSGVGCVCSSGTAASVSASATTTTA